MSTADIIRTILENVKLYMYADDIMLASRSQEDLQQTFNRVTEWTEDNELRLNEAKTVTMTFRKGGKRG